MKNNNTKSTKKGTKKSKEFEVKTTTAELDLTKMKDFTDAEMVCEMACSKLNAGKQLDVSEVVALINNENEENRKFCDSLIKNNYEYCTELIHENCRLQSELAWATRPWYKKLMFWKKKPMINCELNKSKL